MNPIKTIVTVVAYFAFLAVVIAISAAVIMGLGWLVAEAFKYPPAAISFVQAFVIALVLAVVGGFFRGN